MKKILTALLTAAVAAGCSNATKYTITGHDEAFVDGQYAYLTKEDGGRIVTADSVVVADNSFAFKGNVEEPATAGIIVGASQAEADIYVELYLESGNIEIKKVNPEHHAFNAVGTPLNDIRTAHNCKMWDWLMEMRATYEAQDQAKIEELNAKFKDIIKQSIAENKDNLVGVDLLCQTAQGLEPQEIIDIIATMPVETFSTDAQAKIEDTKKTAEAALKASVGSPYINVVDKDADGKEISLESVVNDKANKYVLLDFWASWCGPCMAELPYLKATYDKYHKKGFEIYGVSFDKDRDAWLKAINDKKMNWIHVSSLNAWDNQARADYAVKGIPANFLIDCATGKIVATALRGEALQAKIGELLD